MENMDKGLTVPQMPKMGADKLAENTPNALKFICPNCLPKPKNLGFLILIIYQFYVTYPLFK